ncbi:hypothetical protein T4A_8168 [Trichinella pseudospiralis]|uniref:Uncharacterized protein n=1 Tax=Trichinella pseudospiralis TaxID=6337 RepID=A0A0V1DKS2_TRIPS|nr:hypothetical protein T4A_8168 [Trichinella pseudospiralis]
MRFEQPLIQPLLHSDWSILSVCFHICALLV